MYINLLKSFYPLIRADCAMERYPWPLTDTRISSVGLWHAWRFTLSTTLAWKARNALWLKQTGHGKNRLNELGLGEEMLLDKGWNVDLRFCFSLTWIWIYEAPDTKKKSSMKQSVIQWQEHKLEVRNNGTVQFCFILAFFLKNEQNYIILIQWINPLNL